MAPKTRRAKQKAQSSSPAIPPKFGSGQLNITEKDFAKRYLQFLKKPILPLLLIDLEAIKPFGLDKAVDNLIVSPEWRHLLFDFKEDIHIDLVHEGYSQDQEAKVERLTFLRNEKEFKDEIAIAQGSLKPSQAAHNSTVTFIKEEYKVIQYVLSRSICGRKSGSKVSTMDYLCLYGIIKQVPSIFVRPFITRIIRNYGYQIPLESLIAGSFRMLTAIAVGNTRKRSLPWKNGKRPRMSRIKYANTDEEVDSGAYPIEEELSHFQKRLLARLDTVQAEQQELRAAISQLIEGLANLQTLVVDDRSCFPPEQHTSSRTFRGLDMGFIPIQVFIYVNPFIKVENSFPVFIVVKKCVFKCVRSVWNNVEVDQNMMVESPFPDDFVSPPVVLHPRVQADPPLDDSNHGLANLAYFYYFSFHFSNLA
nr:hypothetical protein Iba_chr06dCG9710 [Ipomoea batatas]